MTYKEMRTKDFSPVREIEKPGSSGAGVTTNSIERSVKLVSFYILSVNIYDLHIDGLYKYNIFLDYFKIPLLYHN